MNASNGASRNTHLYTVCVLILVTNLCILRTPNLDTHSYL